MARRAIPAPPPEIDWVVLTDPAAVRALAHPARLAVIDALYAGEVLTATECAARAHVTPSAMSYHLRALEKHGLVVRVASSGDGRQRPYARAGEALRIDLKRGLTSGDDERLAAELLISNSLDLDRERLLAAMRADVASGMPAGRGGGAYHRETVVLTDDEMTELTSAIDALISPFLADKRTKPRRPQGARSYVLSLMLARETP
jgi:DNA-binding transcriptional ArsR family regulator